jgi:hypothetical protein
MTFCLIIQRNCIADVRNCIFLSPLGLLMTMTQRLSIGSLMRYGTDFALIVLLSNLKLLRYSRHYLFFELIGVMIGL